MLELAEFKDIMENLAAERPLFHSEADFQFALAWRIKEKYRDAKIRLEKCVNDMYIDIIVEIDGEEIPIELKYKTRNSSKKPVTINKEEFNLKNQGAQDNGRYDFVKDISRIEKYLEKTTHSKHGYAIILTNDHLYWKGGENSNSKQFILKNSLTIGEHNWDKISESMKKYNSNRVEEIALNHDYNLKWKDYSDNKFKYLIVEV